MKKTGDKQNRRFLRNSRAAASLANESELKEGYGIRIRHALKRANKAASIARAKSDKVNYHLTLTLTNALLDVQASKLTKREIQTVKHFHELMHMDLKQIRLSKLAPTKEVVLVLFKILKKANPNKAKELSQTFKFRKIA